MLHIKILILVMIYQTYLPNMLKVIIKVIVWESKAIRIIFLIKMCNEILIKKFVLVEIYNNYNPPPFISIHLLFFWFIHFFIWVNFMEY